MGTVTELFTSRLQTSTDNISERSVATLEFLLKGFADEPSAIDALSGASSDVYNGLRYHSCELTECLNDGIWKGKARYVAKPATVVQYDSTGGTQHITQSIATVGKYGAFSDELGNAIGVDGDNVAGVDKVVPIFNWTETHFLEDAELNVPVYYALTGHVNSDSFQGYNAGEVLFYGVTGQEREDGLWEVSFKFGYQPNASSLTVGTIPGIEKKGWEYLWVFYANAVDTTAKVKIKKPTAVYVEQIYDYGPFASLGIGD